MNFAGTPPTIVLLSTSLVTTAFGATITLLPTLTAPKTFAPKQR